MDNSINLIEKLKTDLNLVLPNLKDSNNYLSNLLKSEEIIYNKIQSILKRTDLNLEEKQEELEKLNSKPSNYKLASDFSIPNNLKEVVSKIDLYIFKSLESDKLECFLSQEIITNLNKSRSNIIKSRQILTKERKLTIEFFRLGLKLFKLQDKSTGLFLCLNILFFLRKHSELSDISETNSNKVHLKYENQEFSIDRVILISTLGYEFFEFLRISKSAVEFMLFEEAIAVASEESLQDTSNLVSPIDKLEAVKTNLPRDKAELYEFLVFDSSFADLIFNSTEESGRLESQIGILALLILEASGLIIDSGKVTHEKGNKTSGVVQVSAKYASAIFEIPVTNGSLPMVVRPKFWKKNENDFRRNFGHGGFYFNSRENNNGVLGRNRSNTIWLTDRELKSLNYLQSNFYSINQKYLELVKGLPEYFFLEYLKERSADLEALKACEMVERKGKKSIKVLELEQFFGKDLVLNELRDSLSFKPKSKAIHKKLLNRKQSLKTNYINAINLIMEFVHCYCIADLFKSTDFFFPLSIDTRGRIYYSIAKGGFGLQSNKFVKNYIELKGNSYGEILTLDCINKQNEGIELDFNLSKSFSTDSFFADIKEYFGIKSSVYGIDASCSGSSIISGLLGYKQGLIYTNVIQEQAEPLEAKRCIYEHFKDYLQQGSADIKYVFPSKYIKEQANREKVDYSVIKVVCQSVFIALRDTLLTREHVKHFVMCQNYSQQNSGRADYIDSSFLIPFLSTQTDVPLISYRLRKSISFRLAQWIGSNYKECFPEFDEFCQILKLKDLHKKATVFRLAQSGRFVIKTAKGKLIKCFKPSFCFSNSAIRHEISYLVFTADIDQRKSIQSITANFIHFLDSRLCSAVIYKCLEHKIVLWTNHDCFFVEKKNHELLKQIYFECYKDLLIENFVLFEFLEANMDVSANNKIKKFLEKVSLTRSAVLEDLKTSRVFPSSFILS